MSPILKLPAASVFPSSEADSGSYAAGSILQWLNDFETEELQGLIPPG